MRWRAALVMAVAVGVVHPADADEPPAASEATETPSSETASSEPSERTSKRSSKKRKKSRKKRSKKSKRGKKKVARTPTRQTIRNTKHMPDGYTWPPNRKMRAAGKACKARLDEIGVAWKSARREGRIAAPMTVEGDDGVITLGGIRYISHYRKGPHKIDCHLAAALATFGQDLYTVGVREVKFGSIFRWTNVRVNGKNKPFLSRHALGLAMDIVSFTDATGRVANVERDYPLGDPLLYTVEHLVNGSGMFRILLTPKNDPVSHRDHFHIEVAVDYKAPVASL